MAIDSFYSRDWFWPFLPLLQIVCRAAHWRSHVNPNNPALKLGTEMPRETRSTETATSGVRLPKGLFLLPAVSMDDLKKIQGTTRKPRKILSH